MKKAILFIICVLVVVYATVAVLMIDFNGFGSSAAKADEMMILEYKLVDMDGELLALETREAPLYINENTGVLETKAKKTKLEKASLFSYPGYEFSSWWINSKAYKEKAWLPAGLSGAKLEILSSWTPGIFQVSFDAQGGTMTPSRILVRHGDIYGDALVAATTQMEKYARPNNTFNGWWTTPSNISGGVLITPDMTVEITEKTTLYARWIPTSGTEPTTYKINFYGNGATGGTMAYQTATAGSSITLRKNTFTKDGYRFDGWATSAGSQIVEFEDKDIICNLRNSWNLYAVWSPNPAKQVTITFIANGVTYKTQDFTKGVSQTLQGGTPTRDGCMFLRWNTESIDIENGVNYYNGSSYAFSANTQLYAVWKVLPKEYTLTFIANGVQFNTQQYTEGVAVKLNAGTPKCAGYTFLCWNTKSNASGWDYDNGNNYYMDGITTLWAVWIKD